MFQVAYPLAVHASPHVTWHLSIAIVRFGRYTADRCFTHLSVRELVCFKAHTVRVLQHPETICIECL